jgi:membrane protease YdiL (CAAX protease family)
MLVSRGVEPGTTTTGAGHLEGRMDRAAGVPPHSPTDVVVADVDAPSLRSVLTVVAVLFVVVTTWPLSVSAVRDMDWPVRIAVHLSPFVVMFGVLVVAARLEDVGFATAVGWSTDHVGRQLLTALGLVAATLTLTLLPAALGFNVVGAGETRPLVFTYLAVRTFVLVGFVEEFAWRGYVLTGLRRALHSGPWAIVVSSVVFGLWHFPVGHDLLQVIMAAFIGAIYATARLKVPHCSTLATGTAHGLHDLTLLVLASL